MKNTSVKKPTFTSIVIGGAMIGVVAALWVISGFPMAAAAVGAWMLTGTITGAYYFDHLTRTKQEDTEEGRDHLLVFWSVGWFYAWLTAVSCSISGRFTQGNTAEFFLTGLVFGVVMIIALSALIKQNKVKHGVWFYLTSMLINVTIVSVWCLLISKKV